MPTNERQTPPRMMPISGQINLDRIKSMGDLETIVAECATQIRNAIFVEMIKGPLPSVAAIQPAPSPVDAPSDPPSK